MTNGEKIKAVFPSMEVGFITESQIGIHFERNQHSGTVFDLGWWNAEYKESTTKNEAKYCDRNICLKNEYNNVGCEDCEVTKSQEPTTKNDSAVDCISREGVLKLIYDYKENHSNDREHYPINYGTLLDMIRWVRKLPSVTPQELTFEKINKMKSEVADSLEFWDYSPKNNPLARDMLEILTNFWGDIRKE